MANIYHRYFPFYIGLIAFPSCVLEMAETSTVRKFTHEA